MVFEFGFWPFLLAIRWHDVYLIHLKLPFTDRQLPGHRKDKSHQRGNACAHNAQWPRAMKPVIVYKPLRKQRCRQHCNGRPSRN